LNRDLWGNESLLELIEASFVFWHRTTSSPQGQAFKQLYQVRLQRYREVTGNSLLPSFSSIILPHLLSCLSFSPLSTHPLP